MAVIANLTVPTGRISVLIFPDLDRDLVIVDRWNDTVRREKNYDVPNYGTSIRELAMRPRFAVGWGQFPDGCEVIYLYDREDDCFGYAINLDAPDYSEWGYAPFEEAA